MVPWNAMLGCRAVAAVTKNFGFKDENSATMVKLS